MSLGAGNYDDECHEVMVKTEAEGVALVVINGKKGGGFSINILPERAMAMYPKLPELFRAVADEIDGEMSRPQSAD